MKGQHIIFTHQNSLDLLDEMLMAKKSHRCHIPRFKNNSNKKKFFFKLNKHNTAGGIIIPGFILLQSHNKNNLILA